MIDNFCLKKYYNAIILSLLYLNLKEFDIVQNQLDFGWRMLKLKFNCKLNFQNLILVNYRF